MWLRSNNANGSAARSRQACGFTMVEIALSLAVVAFALVAILGVLPLGMTVQKDNREDTLINQEGRYWIEALKGGARGLDDITNYVEQIKIEPSKGSVLEVRNVPGTTPFTPLDIISLLSTQKREDGNTITNRVTARVKAITGPATEKGALTNEHSFRYQMQVEVVPYFPKPWEFVLEQSKAANDYTAQRFNDSLGANLWDIRLVLRWPVIEKGNDWFVGNNRKTFRARVSGTLQNVPKTDLSNFITRTNLAVFGPNKFDVTAGLNQP